MRLLLITNRYPVDADDPASPFVPHFVRALIENGCDVDVLTPGYRASACEPRYVHRFPAGSSEPVGSWPLVRPHVWVRLWRFLRAGNRAGDSLCRDGQFDHVLALWALPSGYFARRLSRRYRVPYSVWCLGSDIYAWSRRPLFRGMIGRILRGARHLFGDGEDLCRRVETWLGRECLFLPSFRPLRHLPDLTPPRPTTAPRYLYLGRLHRAKGVYELLAAFRRVHDRLPEARLRLVGDGPDARRLRDAATEAGIEDAVYSAGTVGEEEIVRELADCDFVVIPTRSDSLPLVFTEAVQACRPVIGTDVGDLGESIREYGVGLVTPSIRPDDLAAAMQAIALAPVLDMAGRAALLTRMDPRAAARTFCARVNPPTRPGAPPEGWERSKESRASRLSMISAAR